MSLITLLYAYNVTLGANLKTKSHSRNRRPRKRRSAIKKSARSHPGKTVKELAQERGAKPFDPQAFAGIVPPGEDIGAFVEEIYRARTQNL